MTNLVKNHEQISDSDLHRCIISWVPATQTHQVICQKCGEVLYDDVTRMPPFFIQGDCNPGETLGIHVKEQIKVDATYGGKK